MTETITLQFDGGSRGNPGPAGIGMVLRAADGTVVGQLGRFIGRATNNVAEYKALITAMRMAREMGARRIKILGDSELVVKQMRGEYRVKNPDLRVLYDEAQGLFREFDAASIDHNYREDNALADGLANKAMDLKVDVTDLGGSGGAGGKASPLDAPTPQSPEAGDRFACARCGCSFTLDKPSGIRPHQLKPFVCQCGAKMQPL